eukprot:290219_1
MEDDPSLLVVVIDVNATFWAKSSSPVGGQTQNVSFADIMDQIFVFLNSFLLLNRGNRLAVIGAHPRESRFVYPTRNAVDSQYAHKETEYSFGSTNRQIVEGLTNLMKPSDGSGERSPLFAGALSLALCYIRRMVSEYPRIKPRILAFNASEDLSSEYIPVMNCIFSAQKLTIPLDVCMLAEHDSLFMQQAAHLTKGIYHKPVKLHGLLQHLMMVFLPDSAARKQLVLPEQSSVDFRATCFCHRRIIDEGYVCPVCLSIFCTEETKCKTCSTRLPKTRIKRR